MSEAHTLYAITHSLYSGRARSYLIKNGIGFTELSTGHESFKADVVPKAQKPTIPTLVTADGEVIRDGAAIIEYFEAANGRPCRPATPRQQILSALFDVIGTDGLLRPAMHYRWNFPDQNLDFLRYHFYHSQRDLPQRDEKTEHMMNRMRFAGQVFGVTEDSIGVVEALYLDFLSALNTHFEQYPYLLGWRPCIGDFGLIAPMYAHLGRDPYPLSVMQQRATRVYRWVERMNRLDQDVPEYFDAKEGYLTDDEIPQTLLAVLNVIAEDFLPETRAAAQAINTWLAEDPPDIGAAATTQLGGPIPNAEFQLRGQSITALVQPYRFYLLQRVQDIYEEFSPVDKSAVEEMLSGSGLAELFTLKLDRRLGRKDNLEVWL